jgi:hypothetical protein
VDGWIDLNWPGPLTDQSVQSKNCFDWFFSMTRSIPIKMKSGLGRLSVGGRFCSLSQFGLSLIPRAHGFVICIKCLSLLSLIGYVIDVTQWRGC